MEGTQILIINLSPFPLTFHLFLKTLVAPAPHFPTENPIYVASMISIIFSEPRLNEPSKIKHFFSSSYLKFLFCHNQLLFS